MGLLPITIGPFSGKIMSTSLNINYTALVDCTSHFISSVPRKGSQS
jgi:hypothetical protein